MKTLERLTPEEVNDACDYLAHATAKGAIAVRTLRYHMAALEAEIAALGGIARRNGGCICTHCIEGEMESLLV